MKKPIICIAAALFSFLTLGTLSSAKADNCAAIRNALSQLPATGGEVVIPAGNFICDAPIILNHDNVSLRGGKNVHLRLGDNANSPLIIMGNIETPAKPVFRVQVSDLQIDGNRKNQKDECWGGKCDSGGRTVIRNNGITVRGVVDGSIKNIFITGPRSGGVVTEKNCANLVIDGLSVTDSAFDGFAGYETTGAVLSNLNLHDNAAAGISIDIDFSGNTIRDSKLTHNGDVGIFMRDSNNNLFENIVITDSGNHGLFLASVDDASTCPLNNEFFNLTVLRSKGFGFLLNNDCAGNRLSGHALFRKNRDGCVGGDHLGGSAQITCQN